MSMAMPRSDDVRAESQPMMFVLASEMERNPLGRRAIRRSIREMEFLNAHVLIDFYINKCHSFDGSAIVEIYPYEQL